MDGFNRLKRAGERLAPRDRLVLAALLLAALSILLPLIAALTALDRQQRAAQAERLERAVDVVQSWTASQLDRNLNVAKQIAAQRNVEAAVRYRSKPELSRTLNGLKATRDDFIAFYDDTPALIEYDSATGEAPDGGYVLPAAVGDRATATASIQAYGPRLALIAAAPVSSEQTVVGAVLVGELIDGRFVGDIRRMTGMEVAFIGPDSVVASQPDWTPAVLNQALDERTRGLLSSRDRVFEDRLLLGKPYRVAFIPLTGIGQRSNVGYAVLALPAAGTFGSLGDALALLWPWLVLLPLWVAGALWVRGHLVPAATPIPAAPALPALPAAAGANGAPLAAAPAARVDGAASAAVTERSPDEWAQVGPLVVDRAAHEVWLSGKPVSLTRTEFALLWQLARNVGRAQSRDELIDAVWGEDQMAEPAMVDAHIGNLRRKIEPVPGRQHFIVTVRGVGYKMVVPELSDVPA